MSFADIGRTLLVVSLGVGLIQQNGTADVRPDAHPEFVGYLTHGGEMHFAIVAKGGAAPLWLRIHQGFDGYLIDEFDPASETVVLIVGGARLKLRLEGAARRDGQIPAKPILTRSEVLAIARDAVEIRDHWKDPRLYLTKMPSGDYQVLVLNRSLIKVDRRVIAITSDGKMKFYLIMPTQNFGGIPDLLFERFTSPMKRK